MSGTREGSLKVAQQLKERDPDYYHKLGQRGGSHRNPNKDFGSNPALASEAGRKGGLKSRRTKRGDTWQNKANSTSSSSTSRTAPTTDQSAKSSSTSNGGDLDRKTSGFLAKLRTAWRG